MKKAKVINLFIASVWFINGLFCKILNLVPRHQEIVASILSENHSALFTKTIGVLEVVMAIWILTGIKSRLTAILQILIIATMNILEFWLVPDLLLFGRLNIIVALIFIAIIYLYEFHMKGRVQSNFQSLK